MTQAFAGGSRDLRVLHEEPMAGGDGVETVRIAGRGEQIDDGRFYGEPIAEGLPGEAGVEAAVDPSLDARVDDVRPVRIDGDRVDLLAGREASARTRPGIATIDRLEDSGGGRGIESARLPGVEGEVGGAAPRQAGAAGFEPRPAREDEYVSGGDQVRDRCRTLQLGLPARGGATSISYRI